MRKRWNVIAWILIALLFIATGVWIEWARRQPRTQSIWAPDADGR